MILTSHILAGAAIGSQAGGPVLAAVLGFLSHYILDFLPHFKEYDIEGLKTKKIDMRFLKDFSKVIIDLSVGFLIVIFLSYNNDNLTNILIGAFFGALPDGISFIGFFLKNKILLPLKRIHERVHIFKYKKVSSSIKILIQIMVVGISILALIYT